MRKWMRTMLLAVSAVFLLCGSAFAADDIKVLVNDEPIVFEDVQPEAKEGRTYIPMRATFNALGFADEDIVWDAAASAVTAKRDALEISLKLGEKKITITDAEGTREIETDAAAYAANSRTYVPVRFVAEAAGCKVGWDAADRVVLIDDIGAILKANTETYDLMNQYLDYSRKYSEGNIAMNGELGMVMEMADLMSMGMGGEFSAVSNMTDIEMDMDLEVAVDVPYPDENGEVTSAQETQALSIEARGDMDAGVFYFKADELSEMMGMQGDVWFKMDMNAMMSMEGLDEMVGMDYDALMKLSVDSVNMSFEDSLAAILEFLPLTDDDATAKDVLDILNQLCADSAFVKDGTDYVCVNEIEGASLEIVLHTARGKVNGCSVGVTLEEQEVLSMTMKDNEVVMLMQFIDDEAGVGLEMTLGATYSKASKAPAVEPPKGAVIIDLMSMMEAAESVPVETTAVMAEPIN